MLPHKVFPKFSSVIVRGASVIWVKILHYLFKKIMHIHMCVCVWMYKDLPVRKCACVGDRGQPRGYYYAPHVVSGNQIQVSMLIKQAFYWLSYLPSPSINLLISPTTWPSKGRTILFINLHLKEHNASLFQHRFLHKAGTKWLSSVGWLIYSLANTTSTIWLLPHVSYICNTKKYHSAFLQAFYRLEQSLF